MSGVADRHDKTLASGNPDTGTVRGRRPDKWWDSPLVLRLAAIAGILLVWEVGARLYDNSRFLAPLSESALALVHVLGIAGVRNAVLAMALQLATAFSMAFVAATVVGMLVGRSRASYRIMYPLILMAYAFPLVTILPIFVLIFGIGPTQKIAFGFTSGFLPIVVNVIGGCQNVDPALLRLAHTTGANRFQVYRHIVFPHLVPSLFTGMRLGMTGTLLGVILAELYATHRGIGYYTSLFAERFDPASLFALVAVIAAFAITLNELIRRVEIHFGRWRTN